MGDAFAHDHTLDVITEFNLIVSEFVWIFSRTHLRVRSLHARVRPQEFRFCFNIEILNFATLPLATIKCEYTHTIDPVPWQTICPAFFPYSPRKLFC